VRHRQLFDPLHQPVNGLLLIGDQCIQPLDVIGAVTFSFFT